jgi:AbrB family looped-hinge helix DNA binding protein
MSKLLVDTTKVSERGQVVIPKDIRDRMRLTKGTKLLVVATEDAIILQKLETKEEGISGARDLINKARIILEKLRLR